VNGEVNIAFEPAFVGTASPAYNGTPSPGDGYGSCSNIYCHSVAQGAGGVSAPTGTGYKTVAWGSGPLNCGSCHTNMATTNDLTLGTHLRHTNEPGIAQYECYMCHGADYTSSTTSVELHVNHNIDTAFTGTAAGTIYSQAGTNKPGVNGYGTCSSSTCHGRGTKNWGSSSTITTCEKCHGSAATAQAGQGFKDTAGSTGSAYAGTHVSHLAGSHNYSDPIACSECHAVPPVVNSAGHMNGVPATLTWGLLTTDNGTMTPAYSGAAGVPARQCSNTYCHSQGGSNELPRWGDPAYLGGTGCGKCHGNPPAWPHMPNSNCSGCHDHVDASNVAFDADYVLPNGTHINGKSLHLNGEINVSQDDCLGCHSDTGVNALIGSHGKHTDAEHFLVGKKLSTNDYDDPSWIYNISYVNGFPTYACGFCHPADSQLHKNGLVDLDLDPAHSLTGSVKTKNAPTDQFDQIATGTNVVCMAVYCHSNGYVSPSTNTYRYVTTPNWYDPSPWATVDRCGKCHGNSPNTNGMTGSPAHAAHVVGVHYKDLFSGTNGKMTATGAPGSGSAHGDPATSGTINCNICHIDTVKVSYNDKNIVCATCHTGAAGKGVVTVDSSNTSHVNGIVNVSFDPSTLRSRTQVRDDITKVDKLNANWTRTNGYKASNSYDASKVTPQYLAGTCASVSCHNGTTMQWSAAGPLSCSACHKGLPQ
jgi:predicted CxxxxCH...CXXCH cytochrome family protein